MKKSTIITIITLIVSIAVSFWITNNAKNDLIPKYSKYSPALNAADNRHKHFSEINFDDPESVVRGAMTLSNDKQCKIFFHSNGWEDLDQMEKDGAPYWNCIETLRDRAKKTFYLCIFKYNSLESGVVTFVILNDKNYNSGKGAIGPLLLVRERDGWRMALSDVGYGKDIEMFYGDWDFWKNLSNINKDTIREEFRKIRESLKEDSSHELEGFN